MKLTLLILAVFLSRSHARSYEKLNRRRICYETYPDVNITKTIHLELQQSKKILGTISIGVFGKLWHQTTKNFVHLATKGINAISYKGSQMSYDKTQDTYTCGQIVCDSGNTSLGVKWTWDNGETGNPSDNIKSQGQYIVGRVSADENHFCCQFMIGRKVDENGRTLLIGKLTGGEKVLNKVKGSKVGKDGKFEDPIFVKKCSADSPESVRSDLLCLAASLLAVIALQITV